MNKANLRLLFTYEFRQDFSAFPDGIVLHLQFWLQARRLIIVTIRAPVMYCQPALDGWMSLMECSISPYVSLKYLSLSECSSFLVLNRGRPGSSSWKLVVCDLWCSFSDQSSSSFLFPSWGREVQSDGIFANASVVPCCWHLHKVYHHINKVSFLLFLWKTSIS